MKKLFKATAIATLILSSSVMANTANAANIIGDANCDGTVDISDVVAIKRYLVNSTKYPMTKDGMQNSVGLLSAQGCVAIQNFIFGSPEIKIETTTTETTTTATTTTATTTTATSTTTTTATTSIAEKFPKILNGYEVIKRNGKCYFPKFDSKKDILDFNDYVEDEEVLPEYEILQEKMKDLGYSQYKILALCGTTPPYVWQYFKSEKFGQGVCQYLPKNEVDNFTDPEIVCEGGINHLHNVYWVSKNVVVDEVESVLYVDFNSYNEYYYLAAVPLKEDGTLLLQLGSKSFQPD